MIEKINFIKRRIGIKSEKCANKVEIRKVWKQVTDEPSDHRTKGSAKN